MYRNDSIIRITKISIENIKNVGKGIVNLNETDENTPGASIVGIYGQNGSGKTALIFAIELVKNALLGISLPKDTFYYINYNSDTACIEVEFSIIIDSRKYEVFYSIILKKLENEKVEIISERLEYSSDALKDSPKICKSQIIGIKDLSQDISIEKCYYCPETRIRELITKDKQVRQKLVVLQAIARENSTSYIFNEKILDLFKETFKDSVCIKIMMTLKFYCTMNLFVLNKNQNQTFNMNFLPLSVRLNLNNGIAKSDALPVGLGRNSASIMAFATIKKVIEQINVLLSNIITGLTVEIVKLANELNEKNEEVISFELVSNRNGTKTPLKYESEGIKKILYILSSLIAMYNDTSIFVAIDELDSGVFEYLLGEILSTINKTGKGQLLFTSHNMRPLEVLDNKNIYFTTTNADNKYIQFSGVKPNSNLRNTLLRTIDLGGQKESVYDGTSSYKIGKAFRKAGALANG